MTGGTATGDTATGDTGVVRARSPRGARSPDSGRSTIRADARETIVGAAVRVIGRDGMPAASLSAIAAEAGVSKASLLYHFRDRQELLLAVAEEGMKLFRATLERAGRSRRAGGDPLRAALRTIFSEENRSTVGAVREIVSLGVRDPRVAEVYSAVYEELADAIVPLLPEDDDALRRRRRARALVTLVQGHVERWLCSGARDPGPILEEAILAIRAVALS